MQYVFFETSICGVPVYNGAKPQKLGNFRELQYVSYI